jgi:hypothetical protein
VANSAKTHIWLVVSTPLKNISQWKGFSHILWKIKHVPNHQPEHICLANEAPKKQFFACYYGGPTTG